MHRRGVSDHPQTVIAAAAANATSRRTADRGLLPGDGGRGSSGGFGDVFGKRCWQFLVRDRVGRTFDFCVHCTAVVGYQPPTGVAGPGRIPIGGQRPRCWGGDLLDGSIDDDA